MSKTNYALVRKADGKLKFASFKQTLKSTASDMRTFCFQGKRLTSCIKIVPTPSNAKVTILADGFSQYNNDIVVAVGTEVYYKVECDGYWTYESSFVASEQDYSLNIELDKEIKFELVVDTTKNLFNGIDNTFIVPFTPGTYESLNGVSVKIDWGDGTITEITDGVFTQENCTHTYDIAKRYTISVYSDNNTMPTLLFGETYKLVNSNAWKVLGVTSSMLAMVTPSGELETNVENLFKDCINLSNPTHKLFKNNPQITNVTSCFENCSKINMLMPELMTYIPNIEYAESMFSNCDGIDKIPSGFLQLNTKLLDCSNMFYGCDNLALIPNNLFANNKKIYDYSYCFYGCEKLTYNPLVFGSDFSHLGNVENINFAYMFYRDKFSGTDIGTAPEIWDVVVAPLEYTQGCFGEDRTNETLSNYWRIPFEWGGAERIQVDMEMDPSDVRTILYDYNLFELPYYKEDGWNRVQVKPTPSDADVNIVHTLNGWEDDYKSTILYSANPGIIDNGLVSSFSSGNYLTDTFSADLKSANNWEIEFKCTIGRLTSSMQLLVSSNTKNYDFVIGITASNKFGLWLSSNGSSQNLINGTNGSHTLQNGETYYVKCEFTGSAYNLYLKKNKNDTYEKDVSLTSSTKIYSGASMRIGTWIGGTSYVWNGSIDLNEFTVKRNGSVIWNGTKYTKVGFWDDNNVLGPFSSANYGLIPYLPYGTINSFEYKVKITTGASVTAQQGLLANSSTNQANSQLIITTGSKFRLDTALKASTWGTAVDSTVVVKPNTTYWVICGWRNGQSYIQASTDGINYETPVTIANATCHWVEYLGIGIDQTSNPFQGTIHLKESYVKVNDKIVWDMYTHEYRYWDTVYKQNEIITGNMGVVRQGSASGFGVGTYIRTIPAQFTAVTPTADNWEMVIKFKHKENTSAYQNLWCQGIGYSTKVYINTGNKLHVDLNNTRDNNWLGNCDGITILKDGEIYWMKLEYTGTQYILSLSKDGKTFNFENSIDISTKITDAGTNAIGLNAGESGNEKPNMGTIYLNESYIKVNGELWWDGSEYTTVGFWNDEGKLIGANATNYIQIPTVFNPGTTPWEFVTKFKTGSKFSSWEYPFGCTNGQYGLLIGWNSAGQIRFWISSNGTSWNLASSSATGAYSMLVNTIYYVKVLFNGKFYEILISTDGKHWRYGTKVASTTAFKGQTFYLGSSWDRTNAYLSAPGYIDLNETYININGKRWWDCQTKDRTNYVTTIKDKEFLALPNQDLRLNVAKEGYDDSFDFYTFNDDTTLNITLTESSEI